jgi:hypothetical protein
MVTHDTAAVTNIYAICCSTLVAYHVTTNAREGYSIGYFLPSFSKEFKNLIFIGDAQDTIDRSRESSIVYLLVSYDE